MKAKDENLYLSGNLKQAMAKLKEQQESVVKPLI